MDSHCCQLKSLPRDVGNFNPFEQPPLPEHFNPDPLLSRGWGSSAQPCSITHPVLARTPLAGQAPSSGSANAEVPPHTPEAAPIPHRKLQSKSAAGHRLQIRPPIQELQIVYFPLADNTLAHTFLLFVDVHRRPKYSLVLSTENAIQFPKNIRNTS